MVDFMMSTIRVRFLALVIVKLSSNNPEKILHMDITKWPIPKSD